MDIQKLKYFHSVAKIQNITKAAESLHISQPSLSHALHVLEWELGVPLLKKQGRRIALTEFGIYLDQRLNSLLPEFDNLPTELLQLKNKLTNTIKLNILAASSFVINVIVKFRELHPEAVFDFEQNEIKQDCDIVVKTNGSDNNFSDKSVKRCVKKEKIYLVVPKNSEYAKLNDIDLRSVKNEGFVMLSGSRPFGIICGKLCSIAGFNPKILFESDSPIAVQNIIGTGTGIAFWPEYSWGKIKNRNIVKIPVSYPECQRDLIIELHERLPKAKYAEAFYEYLKKQL